MSPRAQNIRRTRKRKRTIIFALGHVGNDSLSLLIEHLIAILIGEIAAAFTDILRRLWIILEDIISKILYKNGYCGYYKLYLSA